MKDLSKDIHAVTIRPSKGWERFNLRDLFLYRDLLYFLTWRDVKVRYKQTFLGSVWAVLKPFFTMIVFTIFFGKIAKLPSEDIPYPIFSYSGLLLWTYFSQSVIDSTNSLVLNAEVVTKVYFPRIFVPLSTTFSVLVDYFIALGILVIMMFFYKIYPTYTILFLPLVIFFAMLSVAGIGFWLSALNVKYRDVRYVVPFFIQLLLFTTPVIYPTTILPERFQWLLSLNPISGVIDAHRACLLGHKDIEWFSLWISVAVSLFVFYTGLLYFRRTERFFADFV